MGFCAATAAKKRQLKLRAHLFPPADMTINRLIRVSSLLRIAAVCLAIGLDPGVFAQDAMPANPTEQDCQQATAQSSMRACENARFEVAQRELNSAYQSLLHQLDDAQRLKLRQSQRAWLRFRDTNAAFQAGSRGRWHAGTPDQGCQFDRDDEREDGGVEEGAHPLMMPDAARNY